MRYLTIFLSLLLVFQDYSWATVGVMRFPSGTPTQVCQPNDANAGCGASSGSVSSVSNSDKSLIISPTTGSVVAGINWPDLTEPNMTGVNWQNFPTLSGNNPFLGTQTITNNSQTPLMISGGNSSFYQGNIQNTTSGANASSDWVATADTGNNSINYVDLGINSSGGGGAPFTSALEGYVYSASTNLDVGALGSGSLVRFFANGSTTPEETISSTAVNVASGINLNLAGLTVSQILALDGSGNVQSLAVATYPSLTELTYLKGVTSAIQTQLNGKQASGSYLVAAGTTTGATSQSQNFTDGITLNATTIVTDTTTGLDLAGATNQKVAFYGVTPVAQQSGDILTALGGAKLGLIASPTISQADVTGLTTGSSPTFTGLTLTGLGGTTQCLESVAGVLTGTGSACGSGGGSGITVGTTTITSGSNTNIEYNNSGVVGEYTITGSGTVVVMATSPTITTPVIASGLTASGSGSNNFSGSTGAFQTSSGANTLNGTVTITPPVRSSGVAAYFTLNIPADTSQTAATESAGFKTVTATRQWASTGTVALQRENFFAGPTYTSVSASQTFTDAFTLYATPPIAGTNAIFTRGHTLGIVDSTSASSAITGAVVIATTLGTSATSVGIGGGNINAGGNGTFGGTLSVTGHVTLEGVTSTGATGTNLLVFATSPTLTTPTIGAAVGTSLTLSSPNTTSTDVPNLSNTATFTNKRVTPRTVTTTQAAAPAINTDNGDSFVITGLAQAITSFTTNLTGTPVAQDIMEIIVTDNGTARAITFGTKFEAAGNLALPTTTVISTQLRMWFQWDAVNSKWCIVGVA